ncbi:ABC transporter permease [Corticibacter populi]|uniref:ABC transporter permease n=2 Tax=Corticibacter populi TaxID=1550736 RepID=A0A3M6QV56_9BURK|nr:ABC transporter permease [Corticibacter populi]
MPRAAGRILRRVAPVLALLSGWQLLAMALDMEELPGAWQALQTVPQILSSGEDVGSILASLRRMAIGYVLALLMVVPLGLSMGRCQRLARVVNPLAALAYPIPKAALMPIIMLWFGIGDLSKILVIFLGVSLPLLYHSYQGALQVDEKLWWSARAMGMGAVRGMLRVVLPAALPEILLGCRVAVSMALITMISSEMIARQRGAGDLLFNALDMAVYTEVYAMIVIIAVIGLTLDALVEWARRRLTHWTDAQGAAG